MLPKQLERQKYEWADGNHKFLRTTTLLPSLIKQKEVFTVPEDTVLTQTLSLFPPT